MIQFAKSKELWLAMLVMTLFSTIARSQHAPSAPAPTKNRIADSPVASGLQRGNQLVVRNKPGEYKNGPPSILRGSHSVHARTIQDCSGLSCVPLYLLPVKLIEFNGVRLNQSQVQLSWVTSEEVNNDYFEVERTLNPANGFQVVGSVAGKINSKQKTSYQLTDPNSEDAYTYYRLKQVDLDGSSAYSRIIAVKGFMEELSVIPFPNPAFARDLKFRVSGHKNGEILSVQVVDVNGNSVYQNHEYYLAEDKQISLSGIRYQTGSFVITIKNTKQQASSSFVMIN